MVYLDHAATSPLRRDAREAMLPYLDGEFGNPSGLYPLGLAAQSAVDVARTAVADSLGCREAEVLFTSGGTESINAAMLGIAYAMRRAGAGFHVITTAIEHHAGLRAAQHLEELGFDVTYLGCDSEGRISVSEFARALRAETVLASVMLANNEVGTVQPVADLAGIIKEFGERKSHRVLLHTDAVQAPGWLSLDAGALGIDAMSLSSHKFGGPKGSGILYLRRATPFRPLILGGGQEMQKRAGTENVAGIVGTSVALSAAVTNVGERSRRAARLRDRLRDGILATIPGAVVHGSAGRGLPNNLNVSFEGIESDALVRALADRNISVSSGSACSNSMWEPSHVLVAMGVPIRRAVASLRFSLGEQTTADEIDEVLQALPIELARVRVEASTGV